MTITEALETILGARYGRNVRQAIHDGIKQAYDDAIKNGNANMEVSQARGSYPSLGSRLDGVNTLLGNLADATPKFASNVSGMTDITKLYVNTSDGLLYVHNGTSWISTGVQYQSTGIAEGSVTRASLSNDIKSELDTIVSFPSKEEKLSTTNAINFNNIGAIGKFVNVTVSSATYDKILLKVCSDNLINFSEYSKYDDYLQAPVTYYLAKPIYLKPLTTYKIIIKIKDASIPPTLSKDIYINQNPDRVANFINAHNLKTITEDTVKTITTTATGLLFIMGANFTRTDLTKLVDAFDVMIVEDGQPENHKDYSGFTEEVVTGYRTAISPSKYKNVIVNFERTTAAELKLELADINLVVEYTSADTDLLAAIIPDSVTNEQSQGIKPLYVDSIASIMRYGSYTPEVMRKDERTREDGTIGNTVFNITGSAGDEFVTVTGGNITLTDIANETLIAGVIQYDDKICKTCSMVSIDASKNKINIYPPLEKNIIAGEIGNLCVDGLHLSRRGYRAFMQNVFYTNPKYAEKGKYTSCYVKTNYPIITTSHENIEGGGTLATQTITGVNEEKAKLLYGYQALDIYNNSVALLEQKSGRQFTLATNKKKGYCEIIVSGITPNNTNFKIKKDIGFEMYIEFYADGILQDTFIKTDNLVEAIRFDFDGSDNVKVVFYYNKMRQNIEHILISGITCWINEYDYGNYLIPPYKVVGQMFDSWGVFHNSESATEMQRLINNRDGVNVRYTNNSLGSQTSVWGISEFYNNVEQHKPQIMLIDFGINDANLGVTQDKYKENMLKLCDMAIANNIQPIVCFPSFGNTFLGDRQLYLMHQEVVN